MNPVPAGLWRAAQWAHSECCFSGPPPPPGQAGLMSPLCPGPAESSAPQKVNEPTEQRSTNFLLYQRRQGRPKPNSVPCAQGLIDRMDSWRGICSPEGGKHFLKVTELVVTELGPKLGLLTPGSRPPSPGRGTIARASVHADQRALKRAEERGGQNTALLPPHCVILGKSLHLSEPRFAQTYDSNNTNICLTMLV